LTNKPIGIFDSGLGGLTVVKKVIEKLPHESIAYVGDQFHVPYGERTPDEIRSFALGITGFLIERHAKLVIMACNMSSATALDAAHKLYPGVPAIGVIEAGVRAAIRVASGRPIGVLATTGTVSTRAYSNTLLRLMPEAEVIEQPCPLFVPLIEAGKWNSDEAREAVGQYVRPLISDGCNVLILGCTHYPFLNRFIKQEAGPGMTIIDPAEETAVEAANILFDARLLNPPTTEPAHSYFTTGDTEQFAGLGSPLLGSRIAGVRRINWGLDMKEITCQEKTAAQTTKSAL